VDSLTLRAQEWKKEAQMALGKVSSLADLESFNQHFLGKKSILNTYLKSLKDLPADERKVVGPQIQAIRTDISAAFSEKQAGLEATALAAKLEKDWIDVTKYKPSKKGALHPISRVQREVEAIFSGMGFEIADGPEVETEWSNFDALNVPVTHPARDMQDTFFVKTGDNDSHKNTVLRTQTSNVQIQSMLKDGAPVRLIAPGRVFRNEDVDATHDAVFYQVEGLLVDKGISLVHLKGTVETMLEKLFEKEIKVRFRPGYFPFVEPGLEVDIWFEFTDKNGHEKGMWLEFMGAGMVHPNVLKNCKIDPTEYSGFAFGFGLTRLTMMKYGIEDIRLLFSNKVEFLEQF
jgi:phenylalanyl-tRNA synthetase alpha chain